MLVEVRDAEDSYRVLVAPAFDADRPTWPTAADARRDLDRLSPSPTARPHTGST